MGKLVGRRYYFIECPLCNANYAYLSSEVYKEKYLVPPINDDDNGVRYRVAAFCEICNKTVNMDFIGDGIYTNKAIDEWAGEMKDYSYSCKKDIYSNLNLLPVSEERINEILSVKTKANRSKK